MADDLTYVETQFQQRFLRVRSGTDGSESMLQWSPTNRTVPVELSKTLAVLRMVAWRLSGNDPKSKFMKLDTFCTDIEQYQMTVGEPKNARTQKIEALKALYNPQLQVRQNVNQTKV